MTDPIASKLYLITPSSPSLGEFPDILAELLDLFEIACVRMGGIDAPEQTLAAIADALRPVCHQRDVPLVATDHFRLVAQTGLDGVHLSDGSKNVRAARAALAEDSIVGAYSKASRHDGLTSAEIGADYVSFGPMSPSSLGDGTLADPELFTWWSETIEIPVVAEGRIALEQVEFLSGCSDFIALGEELWTHPDGPKAALTAYNDRLKAAVASS